MRKISNEMMSLICLFNRSDRDTLIGEISTSLLFIDDSEMTELMRQTIGIVGQMTDEEFAKIEFEPMWDEDEGETYARNRSLSCRTT